LLFVGSSSSCSSSSRIYTAGRRTESQVWSYFKVDLVNKNCECQVVEKSGKLCGRVIAGKNTTNAKAHLKAFHKDTFIALDEKEKESKKRKATVKLAPTPSQPSSSKITTFLKAPQKWAKDSSEKHKRDESLVNMVVGCGLPMNTVGKPSFKEFCNVLDPRYQVPSSGKFNKLFEKKYLQCKNLLLETLQSARRVTIGMDIWTKKGYTSSYLGITACFFDPRSHKPVHALLNLYTINHPHTGDMSAYTVHGC